MSESADTLKEPGKEAACDLLVIGSGAGGLSTAVTAAFHGLKVIVVEKEPVFGGTTAWSGGWLWVPRNPLARRAGIVEDKERIRTYLRAEIGNHYDNDRIEAFLEAAPHMVGFFERHTALQFIDGNKIPDMHGGLPGAGLGGRSVCAAPFDGRQLGPLIGKLRPPLREISFFGMGIASGADLGHFMNAARSLKSFVHAGRRFTRHLIDLARHRRGMHLVNGNALAARLGKSAADLGVRLWVGSPAKRLLRENGTVSGAVVATPDGDVMIHARCGVVLACGGFPHDIARKRELFAHAPTGHEHWSAAPKSNTGDGLRLGEQAGGEVDASLAAPGAWAPVSLVPRPDGGVGHFPHLIERAKPGFIAVTAQGRRFVNEADGYHDFVQGMIQAAGQGTEVTCWGICDHWFIRRYGLGFAKPAPLPLTPYLRSGYLKRGRTLEELGAACGIDPAGLGRTVEEYNRHARRGEDPEFGRGSTPYNRVQGDAGQQPNPCVAPVERGPFYAVKIVPGSLGTFAGLKTDAVARVLDGKGAPIAGLYAVGTDAASIMGGFYPAGGINLGPAMTFGYLAGRHAAGVTEYENAADAA
jgi:succinate dehydrogenase/fumarate reductase flavoprotein subunit